MVDVHASPNFISEWLERPVGYPRFRSTDPAPIQRSLQAGLSVEFHPARQHWEMPYRWNEHLEQTEMMVIDPRYHGKYAALQNSASAQRELKLAAYINERNRRRVSDNQARSRAACCSACPG